jgi:hypothetical protein
MRETRVEVDGVERVDETLLVGVGGPSVAEQVELFRLPYQEPVVLVPKPLVEDRITYEVVRIIYK